ncbi:MULTISPECIES: EAL domain-containing protein [unclassified Herbaspirillum]|uniref:bifunctional diguanylate cyclase/phosphodiesterase n=1 Tax=unclassified Herbaspirillum TaxID=2624150 RepID=UPI00115239E6|nr:MULTISPECIES: EAL domain-containing protein [unclassified Herbaspirillum]MBB5393862.1 diguanylate cyclase (GGDEF)-like protein/PAS domain S-box-containing protein [Herbaspirillum sp. SJZ102]TQK01284.1 PAS domain S-box-containing protein/diguanylate cyclase (GGDEF)-like protein [Herbaspirillum sp. SJZ130]TQK05678.1 PAS domain S-box-containing protein/diguanylate cyclase (GGDEF)-like protein [Herbaspirillum sp. SJZ106]
MRRVINKLGATLSASLTLMLGLCATTLVFIATSHLEDDAVSLDFDRRAALRTFTVQRGLEEAVQVLSTINHFYATVGDPTRQQFRNFTEPLLERYPYVRAFAVHRFVADDDRQVFEALRQGIAPDFQITTLADGKQERAPQRPFYLVVDYIEPVSSNRSALGLDMSANQTFRQALETALASGRPASTLPIRLVQLGADERGLLLLQPVYRGGIQPNNVDERRAIMIGDTAAVLQVTELVSKILDGAGLLGDEQIGLRIFVGPQADESSLVYRHDSAMVQSHAQLAALGNLFREPSSIMTSFDIAGQTWHVEISTPPRSVFSDHYGSLLILLAGIISSLLGAAYLRALALRSDRVQRLVEEKTAELRHTNALLSDDIKARRLAERALQLRHQAIEASANAIIILSAQEPDYPIEYVNPAFGRITGYSPAEAMGRSIRFLEGRDSDPGGFEAVWNAMREQREYNVVLRNYHKDGSELWNDFYIAPVRDDNGAATHFVAALYDITSMKRYEAELEFQASRDTLTGLINRHMLRHHLDQAIGNAERQKQALWLVFVDLDRFKFVNDTLGHKAGDTLLRTVAGRLRAAVREADTVARLGGDEFIMILPEQDELTLDTRSLQRIMDAVAAPIALGGHTLFMTCSIGVACYPADGIDGETLIRHADIAMYRGKQTGRNNFQFYTPAMNEQALERLRIEADLRGALENNEFLLHYQPKVDLASGRVVGSEALIRWQHPQLGMVSPARFIGLAEETGLILPIGAWVLRTACVQCRRWQLGGHDDISVSVNLSVGQFLQKDLVTSIAEVLEDTGLPPASLELELTESLMMTDVEHAIGILGGLKELGVRLSIDDFGTGYSSLAYLKRFPIDVLKIDRSFVRDITIDADDAAITASIISLARHLKLRVIAEGVETDEQLDYLRHYGCDEIQGYLFSPPVPAEKFEQLLRQERAVV